MAAPFIIWNSVLFFFLLLFFRKRYEHAEAEFVAAKLDLHRKTERKEMLTEHLLAVIQQNEERKAKKLEELMAKLDVSDLPLDDSSFEDHNLNCVGDKCEDKEEQKHEIEQNKKEAEEKLSINTTNDQSKTDGVLENVWIGEKMNILGPSLHSSPSGEGNEGGRKGGLSWT